MSISQILTVITSALDDSPAQGIVFGLFLYPQTSCYVQRVCRHLVHEQKQAGFIAARAALLGSVNRELNLIKNIETV